MYMSGGRPQIAGIEVKKKITHVYVYNTGYIYYVVYIYVITPCKHYKDNDYI